MIYISYFFTEFFGCLGRLYACEESGRTKCPDTERCLSIEPVVSEVEVTNDDGKLFRDSITREKSLKNMTEKLTV